MTREVLEPGVEGLEERGGQDGRLRRDVDDLIAAYCYVDWQCLHLPGFSPMPLVRLFVASTVCAVLLLADSTFWVLRCLGTLLFNTAAGRVANVLRGSRAPGFSPRRLPRPWSWPYLTFAAAWIWRGELILLYPYIVRAVVRPFLVHHFRRRLLLIRHCVALHEGLPQQDKSAIYEAVDASLENWPDLEFGAIVGTLALPAASLLVAVEGWLAPGKAPSAAADEAVAFAVGYLCLLLIPAFVVKRGLMLRLPASSSWLPGSTDGTGVYGMERRVLSYFGLRRGEFPLDAALFVALTLFLSLAAAVASTPSSFSATSLLAAVPVIVIYSPYLLITALSLGRRTWLGRL